MIVGPVALIIRRWLLDPTSFKWISGNHFTTDDKKSWEVVWQNMRYGAVGRHAIVKRTKLINKRLKNVLLRTIELNLHWMQYGNVMDVLIRYVLLFLCLGFLLRLRNLLTVFGDILTW